MLGLALKMYSLTCNLSANHLQIICKLTLMYQQSYCLYLKNIDHLYQIQQSKYTHYRDLLSHLMKNWLTID